MPSYTLELELFGVYVTDMPGFEIWTDGTIEGTPYSISSSGTSISITVNYGGSLPSSLEFRFNDASAEPGREIEIRSVKINDKYVNTTNFLSSDTLTQGGSSTVDIPSSDFIFDSSEPDISEFTTGSTRVMTAGNDTLRVVGQVSAEVFDALNGRDIIYLGDGNDKVFGNEGNDLIKGFGGNDLISGGINDDRLFGDDGDDQLYGGDGNDILFGGADNDEMHGNAGSDRLNGGTGNDIMTGGDGNDRLNGGDGDDIIYGGNNDDIIIGGSGNNTLDGGNGADLIYGGNDIDIINGGDGNDTIISKAGNDVIHGDVGDDILSGQAGNDTIYGGADLDTIYGGIGDDTLHGDAGNDTIYGDAGGIVAIMEASRITVTQTNSAQWHSVSFGAFINDAVVKMFAEDVDGDPFTLRVRNVTRIGFEFQIDEYDYLDGATVAETISWVAVASGTHTLATGQVVQAGYVTATNEAQTTVNFNSAFGSNPIVTTQVSSDNGAEAVVTRHASVGTNSFRVNMHEQEATDTVHATEDIGWIAIEGGGSAAAGIYASTTGNNVTHDTSSVSFGGSFGGTPILIADMQATGGADPATAAGQGVSSTGFGVFIDEEASSDGETNHANENVGFFAVESGVYTASGSINGSDIIYGGDGDDILYADINEDYTFSNVVGGATMAAEILADGAIGYWDLSETSGTTFDNQGSEGAPIDGSSTGTPTLGAAALYAGGSVTVDFDGTNDGIMIPDSALINTAVLSEKTVELVFNADDVTTRQVLYEEGGNTHGLTIYLDGGNVYISAEHNGQYADININSAVVTGTTYHVAFVFDSGADLLEGFLDGTSMGSVSVNGQDFPSHGGDIGIGYSPDGGVQFHDGEGGGNFYYDGRISDVAVYTTALTQAQLQDHADIVAGTYTPPAPQAIDDVLYGGDGLDTFYGGMGRDVFVFESTSAFNDVDVINAFDASENDAIDISDLLTGYTDGVSDINDFVQLTESGGNTLIGIDANGAAGGASFTDIVQINDVTGLTADGLLLNSSIIA
jgi:hypothetical protein